MRHLLVLLMCVCALAGVEVTHAQDATPTNPLQSGAIPADQDTLDEMRSILEEMRERQQNADRSLDIAFNLLGIFEAIGFLVTAAGGVLAILGVSRLFSATNELREARLKFEAEVRGKEEELEQLSRQLEASILASAQSQHKDMENATLALSLLPLGERQYRAQDYQGAMDTYRRALRLDDRNPVTHLRIGYVAAQSGQLEEARKHLNRALEIDPEFAPALAATGYVYRRIAESMPDGVEKETLLNQAEGKLLEALGRSHKLVDDDGESWWGSLGGLYRRRGQVQEAIRAYERAAEVTPHSSYPFSNLALLYMRAHNRERMLETYQRVERLARGEAMADVDNYYAHADLLVAQLALGKSSEANVTIESVIDIAPSDAAYALELLIDTLERLRASLGTEAAANNINPYIERLRSEINARKNRSDSGSGASE
jgi:tetratricopeptide (TPR) repeat protein